MVTQLVSGVWHGLYPGYIMFFAGSAVFFAHSTVIYNWERDRLPAWLVRSWPWWAVKVFATKQCLDFLAMAFLWLTWKECVDAWASVHYIPLVYMLLVLAAGSALPAARQPQPQRSGKDDGDGAGAVGVLQQSKEAGSRPDTAPGVDGSNGTDGGAKTDCKEE
jgi:lysophospholipid acyltransferase